MANSIGGIVTTLSANEGTSNATFMLVDQWLSLTDTPAGYTAHIATGLAQQAVNVLQAPLVGPRNKAMNLTTQWQSIFHMSPATAEIMNSMFELFRQPNIEGIVIFTEQESTTRQMDVSTSPLVMQRNTIENSIQQTTYVTDNAVPKPRTWRLQGHLTTVLPTDHYLIIKPSLLMQRDYLDSCMRTRKPVVFKSYDNNFHKVLITSMQTSWDPKSLNTMSISLEMVEYVPIEVDDTLPISAKAALKAIGVEVI